jgi:hypothetical protein
MTKKKIKAPVAETLKAETPKAIAQSEPARSTNVIPVVQFTSKTGNTFPSYREAVIDNVVDIIEDQLLAHLISDDVSLQDEFSSIEIGSITASIIGDDPIKNLQDLKKIIDGTLAFYESEMNLAPTQINI